MTAPLPQPRYKKFPDPAHQDLLLRAFAADAEIRAQTISVTDAMMLIAGLAEVAQMFAAAVSNADATHARQDAALAAEIVRAKAAEQANTDAITAEVTRAKAAEKALSDRVAALEARTLVGTTGQATQTLGISLGNTTTNIPVTFRTAMPDANYVPLVTLDSTSVALLGTLSVVLPITNKTKTGCTVTVRNTAAVAIASSVTVYVAALSLS